MNENHRIPEPDPSCFWGFVAEQDPALAAYTRRSKLTDTEQYAFDMGFAAGRLSAVFRLGEFALDGVTDDLERALDLYLAGIRAMIVRRSPRDFMAALAAAAKERAHEAAEVTDLRRHESPTMSDEEIEREQRINDENDPV